MTKKEILQLVDASYSSNSLDNVKVDKITNSLKRSDLKKYIKQLKNKEDKNKVVIALPSASLYNKSRQFFLDVFPEKEIFITEDRLLLLGAKVKYADMVYDFSLEKKLDDFLDFIDENYD